MWSQIANFMQKHAYNPSHLLGKLQQKPKIIKTPKILYINRAVRTDRRQFMERQLKQLGLQFERIDAPTPEKPNGFFNRSMRGSYLSHLELIERIAREMREYIIMEDDALIKSLHQMVIGISRIQQEEWACLYFYGAPDLRRIYGITDVHAYLVNPIWAAKIAGALREKYDAVASLPSSPHKDTSTCVDMVIAHNLQYWIPFWGMNACVIQDRGKFGSDTGWMIGRKEL